MVRLGVVADGRGRVGGAFGAGPGGRRRGARAYLDYRPQPDRPSLAGPAAGSDRGLRGGGGSCGARPRSHLLGGRRGPTLKAEGAELAHNAARGGSGLAAAIARRGPPVLARCMVAAQPSSSSRCLSRSGAPAREAVARSDSWFEAFGDPATHGLFGSLEDCQDQLAALGDKGLSELRCILPGADPIDVIAQLSAVGVGLARARGQGEIRSTAPPPPGWGGPPRA